MKIVLFLGVLICLKVFPRLVIADGTPARQALISEASRSGASRSGFRGDMPNEQFREDSLVVNKAGLKSSPSRGSGKGLHRYHSSGSTGSRGSRGSSGSGGGSHKLSSSSRREGGGSPGRYLSRGASLASSPSELSDRSSSYSRSESGSPSMSSRLDAMKEECVRSLSRKPTTLSMFRGFWSSLIRKSPDESTAMCFVTVFMVLDKFGLTDLTDIRLDGRTYKEFEFKLTEFFEAGDNDSKDYVVEQPDLKQLKLNQLVQKTWPNNGFDMSSNVAFSQSSKSECITQCASMYGYVLRPEQYLAEQRRVQVIVTGEWDATLSTCRCAVKTEFYNYLDAISGSKKVSKNFSAKGKRESAKAAVKYLHETLAPLKVNVDCVDHTSLINVFMYKILKNVRVSGDKYNGIHNEIKSAMPSLKKSGSLRKQPTLRRMGSIGRASLRNRG